MAYRRRFIHLASDAVTVIQTLSDKSSSDPRGITAWFEKLRIGGDGPGELVLKDKFTLRGQILVDHHIAFEYDAGDRWYLGRVEAVEEESPKGVRITLHGLWASLNEVFPGGYARAGLDKPHRMAQGDYWPNDPDHGLQTADVVGNVDDFVYLLYNRYIGSRSNVVMGPVEPPTPQVTLDGFVFRGEDSAAEILRSLAVFAKNASVGVDEYRRLFFLQKRSNVIGSFREGVNLESLKRETDRSLLYNGLQLTGGFIYNENGLISPYRYTGFFRQANSVNLHGMRVARLYVPWIRRNADALRFAREFFRTYASPTTRYPIQTNCRTTLMRPWRGQCRLQAFDGSELVTAQFDRIRVEFDHCPIFQITVGPEDVEFPDVPDDRNRSLPAHTGDGSSQPTGSISSFGTYTGTVSIGFSGTETEISATSHSSGEATSIDSSGGATVTCVSRKARGYDVIDNGGAIWVDAHQLLAQNQPTADYATVALAPGESSQRLVYFDFGFTELEIPDSATIVGVSVILNANADADGPNEQIIETEVSLVRNGHTPIGDNRASQVGTSWPAGRYDVRKFGGANDLWNLELDAEGDIRFGGFGVSLTVKNNGASANVARLGSVDLVVCYKLPVESSTPPPGSSGECEGLYEDGVGVLVMDGSEGWDELDGGSGGWQRLGGLCVPSTVSADAEASIRRASGTNYAFSFAVKIPSPEPADLVTASYQSLMVRYFDHNNFWLVMLTARFGGVDTLSLVKVVSGAPTEVDIHYFAGQRWEPGETYTITGEVRDLHTGSPGITVWLGPPESPEVELNTDIDTNSTLICGDRIGLYHLFDVADAGSVPDDKGGFDFVCLSAPVSVLPTVTVEASDPTATEAGPTTGTFTITRTGMLCDPLTVYFELTGTATVVDDYEDPGTFVTISANAASATVTITPEADAETEGDETVILTIVPDATYIIGNENEATVTITDETPVFCPGGAFSREFSEAEGTALTAIGFGGDAADWKVRSGKAVAEIAVNTTSWATFEGTGAPEDWTATFDAILVDDALGTLNVAYNSFRFCIVDTDNFMELQIASTGSITLNQWVGGTPSVLATQSFSASNGQTVEVVLSRDSSGNLSAASNVATTLTGTQTEHMAATQMALFSYLDGADPPTIAYPKFDDLCVQDDS